MKRLLISALVVCLTLGVSVISHAALIVLEPDDFTLGTNVSNVWADITLSAIGGGISQPLDGFVYVSDPGSAGLDNSFNASTGDYVFGNSDPLWPVSWYGGGGNLPAHGGNLPAQLLVEFNFSVDEVILDFIGNDGSDWGELYAYDMDDNLLDSYTTSQLTLSAFETAFVSNMSGDIAYIIASGESGDTVGIDYIRVNQVPEPAPIPEPSTLLLLGTGLLGIVGIARKRKKY